VKLALLELLHQQPDVVISGMNAGSNAGINVLYSGTVAAAIEGAFYRKTSIAVSLEYDRKIYDFATAARYAREVIEQIVAQKPAEGSLFNVNIPVLELGPIQGVKVMPQNVAVYSEQFDRRVNPRGRTYFWASPEFLCKDPVPDTDVTALSESFITVTPLKFDLTDHSALARMKGWAWKLNSNPTG
jgi:5'-nucleotidase